MQKIKTNNTNQYGGKSLRQTNKGTSKHLAELAKNAQEYLRQFSEDVKVGVVTLSGINMPILIVTIHNGQDNTNISHALLVNTGISYKPAELLVVQGKGNITLNDKIILPDVLSDDSIALIKSNYNTQNIRIVQEEDAEEQIIHSYDSLAGYLLNSNSERMSYSNMYVGRAPVDKSEYRMICTDKSSEFYADILLNVALVFVEQQPKLMRQSVIRNNDLRTFTEMLMVLSRAKTGWAQYLESGAPSMDKIKQNIFGGTDEVTLENLIGVQAGEVLAMDITSTPTNLEAMMLGLSTDAGIARFKQDIKEETGKEFVYNGKYITVVEEIPTGKIVDGEDELDVSTVNLQIVTHASTDLELATLLSSPSLANKLRVIDAIAPHAAITGKVSRINFYPLFITAVEKHMAKCITNIDTPDGTYGSEANANIFQELYNESEFVPTSETHIRKFEGSM